MQKRLRRLIVAVVLSVCMLVLSGCVFSAVDEMYQLPKRSEEYSALQQVIDSAMGNMSYCAPLSGQQRQTVQMADLDGDGTQEYILYAKGDFDVPLRILIFDKVGEEYRHIDTMSFKHLMDYRDNGPAAVIRIRAAFEHAHISAAET